MADRSRARQLAREYLEQGDATGWFEQYYREAEEGKCELTWADLRPNSGLIGYVKREGRPGGEALVVGCGLGDDAEQLADWGLEVTGFDIAEGAIRRCRGRFPQSRVQYQVADLLAPPVEWTGRFGFVFEAYTLQVLPGAWREKAIEQLGKLVARGGRLLVIARGRDDDEPRGELPWPLTRRELAPLEDLGLREVSFDDHWDEEKESVRRFRWVWERPQVGSTIRGCLTRL